MIKNNVLEYKGYHTKVEFDSEALVLRGKIEGIHDLVNFECENMKDVVKEFHEAVDDYLEFCKEVGKEPDKEYKGTFNVRINPELHKKLAMTAVKNGDSLNASVEKAIQKYISEESQTKGRLQNAGIS
ncbi:MAG: type II toxin-antitoxin system HicB family antitoxin [Lachnospiraceae bacterium]|jgi:predicted HicB family RNase H-like nuclease|nr:type II toxin-antitoxin system HicB family antitoxin [Lachnospiraceae bacterium]MCI8995617.1 type II toxin-antitoxin system HicB family antitoxin [Lachnospiraceae bacterium]MCI9132991.1 type II toxin-antitoxin system HicB family antitoxin [Lachnospiraceae bacterium]